MATAEVVAVQPKLFVEVTVYVPASLMVMLLASSPVDQLKEIPPVAVIVEVASWQSVRSPWMVGEGTGLTVMATEVYAVHPAALVAVTAYVIGAVGVMVMLSAVLPVDHL